MVYGGLKPCSFEYARETDRVENRIEGAVRIFKIRLPGAVGKLLHKIPQFSIFLAENWHKLFLNKQNKIL